MTNNSISKAGAVQGSLSKSLNFVDNAAPRDLIVGGRSTMQGRFKAMAACFKEDGMFCCAGTLVASNFVLTAAHCFDACHIVKVNIYFLDSPDDNPHIEVYGVKRKARYHRYGHGPHQQRHDMMLVELSGRSEVTPMMLLDVKTALRPNDKVTILGWGSNGTIDSTADVLQAAEITVLTNRRCMEDYGEEVITPDMLCAYAEGKDGCKRDSGGPLMLTSPDGNYKQDIQVGVVSWGRGCALPDYSGVYARVSRFIDWIKRTVSKLDPLSATELRFFSEKSTRRFGNVTTSISNNGTNGGIKPSNSLGGFQNSSRAEVTP